MQLFKAGLKLLNLGLKFKPVFYFVYFCMFQSSFKIKKRFKIHKKVVGMFALNLG